MPAPASLAALIPLPRDPRVARLEERRARLDQLLAEGHQLLADMGAEARGHLVGARGAAPDGSPLPDLLSARLLAEQLSISVDLVYRLMDRGDLPSVRIESKRLVRREDYVAFLERL